MTFLRVKTDFLMYLDKSGQPKQQISNFDHHKLSSVNEKLKYGLNSY